MNAGSSNSSSQVGLKMSLKYRKIPNTFNASRERIPKSWGGETESSSRAYRRANGTMKSDTGMGTKVRRTST